MTSRPKLSVGDIPIAPRKDRAPVPKEADSSAPAKRLSGPADDASAPLADAEAAEPRNRLPRPSPDDRKVVASQRALNQEKARTKLRDLKRAQTRESKHFVNVPLDYETKMRLQKASFENDLKMTVIMKAAIDQYLRDNGY
jgi:hypothetical protein